MDLMERRDESDGRNKRRTLMLMYLREADSWNEAVGGRVVGAFRGSAFVWTCRCFSPCLQNHPSP